MLIAFLGLIALVNLGLGKLGTSLQAIFGWILAPVAYLLGVPWEDCRAVGGLLGTRTVLNELIAFQELGKLQDQLDRSIVRDRQLCALRVRQLQLDRHPARRHRSPGAGAAARPGTARLPRPSGRDPGQFPVGLYRGDPAMSTAVCRRSGRTGRSRRQRPSDR